LHMCHRSINLVNDFQLAGNAPDSYLLGPIRDMGSTHYMKSSYEICYYYPVTAQAGVAKDKSVPITFHFMHNIRSNG